MRGCIDRIKKFTPEPHEIILLDNESKPDTPKWLKQLAKQNSNIELIHLKKTVNNVQCYNEGVKVSSGQYIVLLHDDVAVSQGWLSRMLQHINSLPDAGIIGPMTNNVDGKQKIPNTDGVTIESLDEYANFFTDKNRYRRVPARHVAGFCMLFQRDLIERIGLLDETLGDYQYATEDFCLRAALEGYISLIAGDVFVFNRSNDTPKRR